MISRWESVFMELQLGRWNFNIYFTFSLIFFDFDCYSDTNHGKNPIEVHKKLGREEQDFKLPEPKENLDLKEFDMKDIGINDSKNGRLPSSFTH